MDAELAATEGLCALGFIVCVTAVLLVAAYVARRRQPAPTARSRVDDAVSALKTEAPDDGASSADPGGPALLPPTSGAPPPIKRLYLSAPHRRTAARPDSSEPVDLQLR
jgi:hypothetical protein